MTADESGRQCSLQEPRCDFFRQIGNGVVVSFTAHIRDVLGEVLRTNRKLPPFNPGYADAPSNPATASIVLGASPSSRLFT